MRCTDVEYTCGEHSWELPLRSTDKNIDPKEGSDGANLEYNVKGEHGESKGRKCGGGIMRSEDELLGVSRM